MKIENIIKRLEKEGYKIHYKKWSYWDGIPHVELNGFSFTIAEHVYSKNGWMGCNVNFIYNHVQEALYIAQTNNPILLKKIKEVPVDGWYYSRWLILSMQDYYDYLNGVYPFDDEYYNVLEKLKKEFK